MRSVSGPAGPVGAMTRRVGAIEFAHPVAFWLGVLACSVGVVLHLPMYWSTRSMGFRMVGMRPDAAMLIGMDLIVLGLAATCYGLVPRNSPVRSSAACGLRARALDDTKLSLRHVGLLVALALAVTIDVMKPTTLAFVAPGMTKEYDLTSALNPHGGLPVALLPLAGISGTVIGSFIWGWLGDRIGRRVAVLLAAVLFATTAICGAMPGFSWNLVMCFLMGIGAGGMLPITFTLLAELVPVRHRGWLMVLVGGDVTLAYVLTSWLASTLIPHYSWRIMWLIGLPTGLLLVLINRWIPESPRFLVAAGREDEAGAVMASFGVELVPALATDQAVDEAAGGFARLLSPALRNITIAILLLGVSLGLVTYGFQLWIPTNLQHSGLTLVTADGVLRDSAIIGFPLNVVAAWLYSTWSSKKTIVLFSALTAADLFVFAAVGSAAAHHKILLYVLLAIPICGISSAAATLAAYGSEIYPTFVRSRGSGLTAGATKAGGVLIIALVVIAVATPSIAVTALLGAIPMAVAVAVIWASGVETRRRPLEQISAAVFRQPELAASDRRA